MPGPLSTELDTRAALQWAAVEKSLLPRAAAELAEMTPIDFMERIRELTLGIPVARDVLASVLKAHGWSSFKTLDRSEYQTALDSITAELIGKRA